MSRARPTTRKGDSEADINILKQPQIIIIVMITPILLLFTIFTIVDTMVLHPGAVLLCVVLALRLVDATVKQIYIFYSKVSSLLPNYTYSSNGSVWTSLVTVDTR